jgi:hypothetical protein
VKAPVQQLLLLGKDQGLTCRIKPNLVAEAIFSGSEPRPANLLGGNGHGAESGSCASIRTLALPPRQR